MSERETEREKEKEKRLNFNYYVLNDMCFGEVHNLWYYTERKEFLVRLTQWEINVVWCARNGVKKAGKKKS